MSIVLPAVGALCHPEGERVVLLRECRERQSSSRQMVHILSSRIAALLKRIWRRSTSLNAKHAFRHLSALLSAWRQETLNQAQYWPDAGMVHE
jgi:hypothetical protein